MSDSRPLRGLRVIEFGNFIAGPFAAMLLADMGAEVIKIEPTGGGDMARHTPPFIDGHSASFMALNRNKRSIALDLKSARGIEIAKQLVTLGDCLVENYRPGVMTALGLGKEACATLKPSLVYVSVSGFGQTSANRHQAAVNLIIEAASGTLSVTGNPAEMPVRPGIQTGDMIGALFAAYAALSGLVGAARHGEGRYADVSLIEASVSAAAFETAEYLATGEVPQPLGNRHRLTAPYQVFRTSDARFIAMGAPNDDMFRRLCEGLDLPELASDARYQRYADRKKNEVTLIPVIEHAVQRRPASEVLQLMEARGVPCSLVRNYEEVLRGAHGVERGIVASAPHRTLGTYETVRNPILLDSGSPAILRGAPTLGEHTREILEELGLGPTDVQTLLEQNVARAHA